jgi:hypothetical protein
MIAVLAHTAAVAAACSSCNAVRLCGMRRVYVHLLLLQNSSISWRCFAVPVVQAQCVEPTNRLLYVAHCFSGVGTRTGCSLLCGGGCMLRWRRCIRCPEMHHVPLHIVSNSYRHIFHGQQEAVHSQLHLLPQGMTKAGKRADPTRG